MTIEVDDCVWRGGGCPVGSLTPSLVPEGRRMSYKTPVKEGPCAQWVNLWCKDLPLEPRIVKTLTKYRFFGL